ncbi:cilia- and flagella-associated protein 97-like [Gigantopelta aegis]|uniref:cilia- and flagella-associated protein 97-like n=1 Tax=Gigantopelta aegis TaxID=1735272 RepID=UPI001B88CCEB|nr:cilia- and flagella-associated protein 97-like [Gigantopelta aegis]
MEEDLSGDVDFDFFDSPVKTKSSKSPSPNPIVSNENLESKTPTTRFESSVTETVSISKESPNQGSQSKDIFVDAASNDNKNSETSHARRLSLESLSESDYAKEYSDSFSDVSSVESADVKKSGSSRSRSSSASSSRSRSSSRESYSHSENSTNSSRDHERSSLQKQSKLNWHNGDTAVAVSFSDQDALDGSGEKTRQKVSQRSEPNVSQRPSTAHHKSRKPRQSVQKQAWDSIPVKSEDIEQKKRKMSQYSEYSDASSRSGSSSDSDMTDVSPLTSPRNSPNKKKLHVQVQYKQMPLNDDSEEYEQREVTGNEDIDLSILMKALCDHEKEKQVMANRRRVMFAPPKKADGHNFTFSNDRATIIDRENQRLLNQLMQNVNPQPKQRHSCARYVFTPPQRITSSAVNRKREQQRIEMDNMAMLRRLQKITPSKGMSRNEQVKEFEKTTLYGVPVADVPHRKRVPSGLHASSGLSQRSRSMNSVNSTSTMGSRRSTASSTKRKTLIDPRPQWCDRW